ncbi:MAG: hypothetical protein L6302_09575 [Desulfobacteraceae bacterium]|nr:hypothetical protein [Desulfobacteraceae bacterium]
MTESILPPLKPIPIKDRVSMIFVYYGRIDVKDGAFVMFPTENWGHENWGQIYV